MIDIHFYLDKEDISSVLITGHAESGPYGQDIVCSAVSALSIGAVNSLIKIAEVPLEVVSDNDQGGYLSFALPGKLNDKQMETAQILLNSLYLSLSSIEEEYTDYLKINSSSKK
ncbi:ribosomal-processing cysteine protease Prp [Alkalibacterium olivapovliticus]|uniref:Ribosomal processing cysteine protease Prp n=1 Tax=Alkalibacterium olivapovliticus TaxID=99907 RepID=A0A2T0WBA8_9LACT|nr:ribosomal-processing cysteine protease Prp [Alkalibacterium olivapovliticus]PRY83916.1 hypothetical protein CLV38_102101 [Alkalibacterium olivapovliticus]